MSNAVGQFSFEYSGERTSRVELPGGVHALYGYDHYDRVSSIEWRDAGSNLIERFAYSYNGADMVTQVGRLNSTNTYAVDGTMDRLLGETAYDATGGVARSEAWTYDAVGNRTSASNAAGTATYVYVSGCNRLASFGSGTSVGLDAAGCVTSMVYSATQSVALAWDGRYRLTEVATNGAVAEAYGYDALNRRAWTSNATDGLVWHIYDGWQVVADVDATGGVLRTYSWMPGKVDRLLTLGVVTGDVTNVYCAITDHIGTVHALTDTNGVPVETYSLDAWGQVLSVLDASSNALPRSALGNRYLFQGREYSWATGLYNFRNRWYDPVTGRWLSKDPIGIAGGLNQYVFCEIAR